MITYSYNQTHSEIKKLQRALNEILKLNLKPDGNLGKISQEALKQYQLLNTINETDKLGVCYGPITQALIKPYIEKRFLTESDFINAASVLKCDVATVKAVTEVESKEFGFLESGFPVVLFERHHFYKLISKNYGKAKADEIMGKVPNLCNPIPGGYVGGNKEVARLSEAMKYYDREAIASTSFGLFQILGSNYKECGYKDVLSFYAGMKESEDNQLLAFCRFVMTNKTMYAALVKKDWETLARLYNGPSYNLHKPGYDKRLAIAYNKHTT